MGLHDSLKIESSTVPECKFSAAGPSEQSPSFRRPSDTVDGMLVFIE